MCKCATENLQQVAYTSLLLNSDFLALQKATPFPLVAQASYSKSSDKQFHPQQAAQMVQTIALVILVTANYQTVANSCPFKELRTVQPEQEVVMVSAPLVILHK